jgi:hypothetical protein
MKAHDRQVVAVMQLSGTLIKDNRFVVAVLSLNEQDDPREEFQWLPQPNIFFSLDKAREIGRSEAQSRGLDFVDF